MLDFTTELNDADLFPCSKSDPRNCAPLQSDFLAVLLQLSRRASFGYERGHLHEFESKLLQAPSLDDQLLAANAPVDLQRDRPRSQLDCGALLESADCSFLRKHDNGFHSSVVRRSNGSEPALQILSSDLELDAQVQVRGKFSEINRSVSDGRLARRTPICKH